MKVGGQGEDQNDDFAKVSFRFSSACEACYHASSMVCTTALAHTRQDVLVSFITDIKLKIMLIVKFNLFHWSERTFLTAFYLVQFVGQ